MNDALVCGVDECGWGAFAGPVYVAAVSLPADVEISSIIKDSKKFSSENKRKESFDFITKTYPWTFSIISPSRVISASSQEWADPLFQNWSEALNTITLNTLVKLSTEVSIDDTRFIVDGNSFTHPLCEGPSEIIRAKIEAIPKADATVAAVAAASIVAKHLRDDHMRILQVNLKVDYGWSDNKGYGTAQHIAALEEHGPHRSHHRFNIQKVMDAYKLKGYAC